MVYLHHLIDQTAGSVVEIQRDNIPNRFPQRGGGCFVETITNKSRFSTSLGNHTRYGHNFVEDE